MYDKMNLLQSKYQKKVIVSGTQSPGNQRNYLQNIFSFYGSIETENTCKRLLTRLCPILPGPHCPCFKFEPKPAFLDTDLIQFIFCSHITVLQILDQPSWLLVFHIKISVCFCCWSACVSDLTIRLSLCILFNKFGLLFII